MASLQVLLNAGFAFSVAVIFFRALYLRRCIQPAHAQAICMFYGQADKRTAPFPHDRAEAGHKSAHCCFIPTGSVEEPTLPPTTAWRHLPHLCFIPGSPGFCGFAGRAEAGGTLWFVGVFVVSAACGSSSPEPVLHHPVPTGPPARARVVTLKDQRRLSHVELGQESAVLKKRCIEDWVSFCFCHPSKPEAGPEKNFPKYKKGQTTPTRRYVPTSPKTPQLLQRLFSSLRVARKPLSQTADEQQETTYIFAAWHHPMHHQQKTILQCCAKNGVHHHYHHFAVLEGRSRCFVYLWNKA